MKLGSEYQDENVTWIRKYAQMDNRASILQGMSFLCKRFSSDTNWSGLALMTSR